MFSKILIANRGEIAVRIIRACKEMGIATVSIYSVADEGALHTVLADESYCIGGAEAHDSYLNENRILAAAMASGAEAIHPGYGFLSESSHFASSCRAQGIAFIGPSAENMDLLADKARVKSIFAEAGLPVIPGSRVVCSAEDAANAAREVGYPVMLKARSGGGGRGIRLVEDERDIERAFMTSAAESKAAFGDDALYLEKYIHPARHVELQILADEMGHVICLGERDCSVQRHNQKLIEESPCPALSSSGRAELIRDATQAVRAIGYVGAGTLEFLMDAQGQAWFMEMNVRLQVEHPVTECLTGVDIVKWQIRAAAGMELKLLQSDVNLSGCAIECRINATSPGKVEFLHVPGGPFVRFDTYLMTGTAVTPHYDSLVGKLIVTARTRDEALRKMRSALCELVIDGVPTNIEEQLSLISRPKFVNGTYDLDFMTK